jgi:hypothetical protein
MKPSAVTLVAVGTVVAALVLLAAIPRVRSSALARYEDLTDDFTPELPFERIVVDRGRPIHVWGKAVADIDKDGDPDLIAGGWEAGGLAWYENPRWQRHQIAEGQQFSTDIETCDVDRDGDQDVVSLRWESIVWYESPSWKPHRIAADTVHDVEVADLDGDGDCDAVARGQTEFNGSGHRLLLYEQVTPASWRRRDLPIPNGEGLATADLDRDGDIDVIINQHWLENTPAREWPLHSFTSSWTHGDAFVAAGDMNGDGRIDIVHSPAELKDERYRVSWFEAPSDPRSGDWKEHIVADSVEAVLHSLNVADFDNDGRLDIATAEMTQGADPDDVRIHLNPGQDGTRWSPKRIGVGGSHSMRAIDIDRDGDIDLFGGNWNGEGIHIYRNDRGSAKRARD